MTSHTWGTSFKPGSGSGATTHTQTVEGDERLVLSDTFPPGDTAIQAEIDVSTVRSVYIRAYGAVSLAINDPADKTLVLASGQLVRWVAGDLALNPLGTVDATSLKITVAGEDPVGLDIDVLFDVLP